jgi:hypothetical protein
MLRQTFVSRLKYLQIVQGFLTSLPALFLLFVGLTSWQGHHLLGRVPVPSIDDPKFIENGFFQGVYFLTLILYLAIHVSKYIWFPLLALTLWLESRVGDRPLQTVIVRSLIHVTLYTLPWIVIAQDPAQRIAWLLD